MRRGIIALPTILLISGIVLEISIALALVAYFLLQSGAGNKFSFEALLMAQAGVDDAVMRIIRNNDFGSGTVSYTLTTDIIRKVDVVVCRGYRITSNVCDLDQAISGKTEVDSLGKSLNKNRKLRAIININPENSEIKIETIEEIPV